MELNTIMCIYKPLMSLHTPLAGNLGYITIVCQRILSISSEEQLIHTTLLR